MLRAATMANNNNNNFHPPRLAASGGALQENHHQTPSRRRSGNYKPPIWDFNFIQSLNNPYVGEKYMKRAEELKEKVRKKIVEEVMNDDAQLFHLEFIDDLQRLGLLYHFEGEVKTALESIYNDDPRTNIDDDPYTTALKFRLFRQHGFIVDQDTLSNCMSKEGEFKRSLEDDTKAMLCLYEASFMSVEGEEILEMAREFTTKHLNNYNIMKMEANDLLVASQVAHALELPIHWRITRLEARWYLDIYEHKPNNNPLLLELAKLDYNLVQSKLQQDLKYVSRWWKDRGLAENITFMRDSMVPSFFWTVGMIDEPQYSPGRRMSAKINALITMIDDVYDLYGTLDELQLFTNVVQRWEINAMGELPHYMKICFLALYNAVNEMAYETLREHGLHIVPYLKKLWGDLCEAYLQEAKWYSSGYKPTLQEYMNNAWVSIASQAVIFHAYAPIAIEMEEQVLESICNGHDILRCSAIISRLANDLGTSTDEMKRGDVPKSVQCCMIDSGVSEEEAREHLRILIRKTYEKMNTFLFMNDPPFSNTLIKMVVNLGRMAQCVYEYGDGHGNVDSVAQDRIAALLFEPIPIED